MESFLSGSQAIAFGVVSTKDERYAFIEKILKRFSYQHLKRSEKRLGEQNQLVAREKWELGQEKAQLLGQLKQMGQMLA